MRGVREGRERVLRRGEAAEKDMVGILLSSKIYRGRYTIICANIRNDSLMDSTQLQDPYCIEQVSTTHGVRQVTRVGRRKAYRLDHPFSDFGAKAPIHHVLVDPTKLLIVEYEKTVEIGRFERKAPASPRGCVVACRLLNRDLNTHLPLDGRAGTSGVVVYDIWCHGGIDYPISRHSRPQS
jgi:hypothetical protein